MVPVLGQIMPGCRRDEKERDYGGGVHEERQPSQRVSPAPPGVNTAGARARSIALLAGHGDVVNAEVGNVEQRHRKALANGQLREGRFEVRQDLDQRGAVGPETTKRSHRGRLRLLVAVLPDVVHSSPANPSTGALVVTHNVPLTQGLDEGVLDGLGGVLGDRQERTGEWPVGRTEEPFEAGWRNMPASAGRLLPNEIGAHAP